MLTENEPDDDVDDSSRAATNLRKLGMLKGLVQQTIKCAKSLQPQIMFQLCLEHPAVRINAVPHKWCWMRDMMHR